jgi:probable rRNA maturation factor
MVMKKTKIYFFTEDIRFKLKAILKHKEWLRTIAETEGKIIPELSIIMCSDEYLLSINKQYLKKDYLTDVIAFSFTNGKNAVQGEIYVSIDRVRENAMEFDFSFEQELRRVMAHGLLHMCGYNDNTPAGKKKMQAREDYHLSTFPL